MPSRRSLRLPITLAVVMTVLLGVLTAGWVLLSVFGADADSHSAGLYWTFLSIGSTFILLLLVGVVLYLALSIKAINVSRRQSNFIDSVTHELKSPIASMKLYLQTLNLREMSAGERSRFHQFMVEDLDRLDHLINHLLDVGRAESLDVEDDLQEVELTGLIRECATAICLRYGVSKDTMRLDLEPCSVYSSPVDLEMIFRNLLDNAVKYGAAEPRVDVISRLDDEDRVIVRVVDNGHGIPRKMRRKVFKRFVRLGMELRREKPGTGLGLYTVHTLVRRLRGSISIQDREGASGTVFELRLPGKRPASEPEQSGEAGPVRGGGRDPGAPSDERRHRPIENHEPEEAHPGSRG